MSNIIKDGKGKGYTAEVTANNRLKTTGVDLTLTEAATETGDTYNINTGEVTLTSSGESALFYFKNDENTNIIIDNIVVNIKDYTGTDGQPELKIYKNPQSGTLITNAVEAEISNRNYGSEKVLSCTKYQGVEGDTLFGETGEVIVYLPTTAAVTFSSFTTLAVLPKGAAIGISYTPPSGVTSMKIRIAINTTLNGTQL